jgi:DNA-binding LacI/PurR family transcriptional regulator
VPPVDEVARMAWERLEQRMAGDTSPVRSIILSAELVLRASAN